MKLTTTAAIVLAALTVAAAPALAVNPHGAGHANQHATDHSSNGDSSGDSESQGEGTTANAYGVSCQGTSRKHVKGEKGTPFSQCVKAMAQLDKGQADSPKEACKGLSKKHVKGEKGTPFSQCIKAAARLGSGDES